VIQEHLGCIKGLSQPLCVALAGKSDSFLPFIITLVLSNHNSRKSTSAQNYLVAITPILRTQIK